ncbi:MAG: hypothetical protein GX171_10530 [Clostridiales bacterium]|jgi:hypothetical protein|nr:hypothetical protein [Clostridiales bacterium]
MVYEAQIDNPMVSWQMLRAAQLIKQFERFLAQDGSLQNAHALLLLEAAAAGAAVPALDNSPVLEEAQAFIKSRPRFFGSGARGDALALLPPNGFLPQGSEAKRDRPCIEVVKALSTYQVLFDALVLREHEPLEMAVLQEYPLLILADCGALSESQQETLLAYARQGGKVLAHGQLDAGLEEALRQTSRLTRTQDSDFAEVAMARFTAALRQVMKPVRTARLTDLRVGLRRNASGGATFLHLFNFNYVPGKGLQAMENITVFSSIKGVVSIHSLSGEQMPYALQENEEGLAIQLEHLPLYAVIEITQ